MSKHSEKHFIIVDGEINGWNTTNNSMFAIAFGVYDSKGNQKKLGLYKMRERKGTQGSKKGLDFWAQDKNKKMYDELHKDNMDPGKAIKLLYEDIKEYVDTAIFVSDNPLLDLAFLNTYVEEFLGIEEFINYRNYIDVKSCAAYSMGLNDKRNFNYGEYKEAAGVPKSLYNTSHHPLDDVQFLAKMYLPLLILN